MADYRPRVVDAELDELTLQLPAVALDGPKGVGKTETARQRATTVFALDDPRVVQVLGADLDRLTRFPGTTLLDEWQRLPLVWDRVRRAVDEHPSPGRFLLTGSTSLEAPTTHSGAGRIVSVRMRPLTLGERGTGVPTVSTAALLRSRAGTRAPVEGSTDVRLQDYVDAIVGGGFPGMLGLTGRARSAALRSYVDLVVDRDFLEAGLQVRNPAALRRWLAAYAAATSTTASYDSVRDAATAGVADKPARSTTTSYLDVLQRIWIADPLPAWAPTTNHLRRLTLAPKHHLADPALAVALTGLSAEDLLEGGSPGARVVADGAFLGVLFESLVTMSVRVFAQAAQAEVFHLRTKGGEHEVDLVVRGAGRRVVAMEVKLAEQVTDADVRHLRWLADQLGDDLLDAVVVTTGRDAYRRRDGIAVVPAALLGP